ncbi:MAG: GNAT family N-acetyltransferase, partial [Coriobacteriales bacterium]|nr:GNAT family N-acetyltransferase [Coriobacteriales bacterium]
MEFDNNDKRIAHWRLRLSRSLDDLPEYPIPAPYRFVRYAPGDRDTWIAIEKSAREFDSYQQGAAAWARYFGDHEDELGERMVFVVDNSGAKVATATAFYDTFGRDDSGSAWLHWVSVRRDHQGRGLAKPLVCEAFRIMRELGYERVIIPTQTNTWLAAKLYLDLGCRPTEENARDSETGWRIVRTLTNHPALATFDPVGLDV